MKMVAQRSFEIAITIYQSTGRKNSEDMNFKTLRSENTISPIYRVNKINLNCLICKHLSNNFKHFSPYEVTNGKSNFNASNA
jgi:hypothetical protein